jgi:hypothetical protein
MIGVGTLLWKLYAGVLGAVAAAATTKLIAAVWRRATGDEPPELTDPEAPAREALLWAVTSAAGTAAAALVVDRLVARFSLRSPRSSTDRP